MSDDHADQQTTPEPPGGDGADGGAVRPTAQPWPERDLPPQVGALAAAVAIGAWAALTWPEREVGLAFVLTLLAAGGLMWRVARHAREPWTAACALLAAALASVPMVRASGGPAVLAVLMAVVVAAAGVTGARTPLSVVVSVLAWPLSALRGLPLLGRTLRAAGPTSSSWPVVRTAIVSVLALLVFGGLFASGDALFGAWLGAAVPDLGWAEFAGRLVVGIVVGGIALAGAYLALNPPPVAAVTLPRGRRQLRAWEWAVPVALVDALFVGFLLAQAAAMWGGHDYVERTTGLTYAEYVHQGFGQLTATTFLTVVVVALTARVAGRGTRGERLLLRGLLGGLCVLTLGVVGSALYRMGLYQDAYGYTVTRLFVDGVELWLGVLVAMLLVAGVRLDGRWVARAAVVSAAVCTLVFAGMNPDAWVARRNIDRAAAGASLDVTYLAGLSADAVPVIVAHAPAEVAACVLEQQRQASAAGGADDDVLSWNAGRARGRAAAGDTVDMGGVECADVLVDDYRGPAR